MGAEAHDRRDVSDFDLEVVRTGAQIDDSMVAYAERKVRAAARSAPAPVLFGRIKMRHEPHRSIERPILVAATLDVDGYPVRAHAAGHIVTEAVDLLEERLRGQLVEAHQRIVFLRRRHTGVAATGEWRHGDEPTARPAFFPRPPEERQVMRTKTVTLDRCIPEDAAVQMEMLDHDFHLFIDSGTDREAVVQRLHDGDYALSRTPDEGEPPHDAARFRTGARPPMLTMESAVERLNDRDDPFLFFIDVGTSRGAVLYRRSDGHYGVVQGGPAPVLAGERSRDP
ncbi:MAG: sigma 54 modulation/S30EA ribosomal C-terminal domain-containing protein [Actinomycetota bacterium]